MRVEWNPLLQFPCIAWIYIKNSCCLSTKYISWRISRLPQTVTWASHYTWFGLHKTIVYYTSTSHQGLLTGIRCGLYRYMDTGVYSKSSHPLKTPRSCRYTKCVYMGYSISQRNEYMPFTDARFITLYFPTIIGCKRIWDKASCALTYTI